VVAASLAVTAPALSSYIEFGSPLGRVVAELRDDLRQPSRGGAR